MNNKEARLAVWVSKEYQGKVQKQLKKHNKKLSRIVYRAIEDELGVKPPIRKPRA